MPSLSDALVLDLADACPAAWRAALALADPRLRGTPASRNLVQDAPGEAPELVICLAAGPDDGLGAALADWAGAVLLVTPEAVADEAAGERAIALGVHHWAALATGAVSPAALAHARAQALARWRHDRRLRDTLARTQAQLDERKWVERAKGVLMSARGMDEEAAFRLLRGAAMSVNLRVGEVSRAVFESARWADAMNRAGQLRMLSQRCVRLVAQRLLRLDARAAEALQAQSVQRVRDNLALLADQCAGTGAEPACTAAARRWQELEAALAQPRIDAAALAHVDACADGLLNAAERLTQALQDAAGRRALHIVNQCGRQRLRVQRVAKESLLAALPGRPGQAQAFARRRDAALAEFEDALCELEAAPLTSADIRTTLEQVREQWLRLLAGLRATDPQAGRRALVHASEALLERLDALTAAYEHSLQVIMG
jgi:AmiR/NasT family two-component response regulator